MKKLIGLSMSFLMVMFFSTSNARETKTMAPNSSRNSVKESRIERKVIREENRNEVSDLSKDAFYADFGNISNVTWERDPLFDIATFTKNGKSCEAFYDPSSKLVGTVIQKKFADLPKDAQKEIKKQYKDYSIDKVIFYKDNEGNDYNILLYGTQFENADNYFVELSNSAENKNIVIQVDPRGNIYFFKELHNA